MSASVSQRVLFATATREVNWGPSSRAPRSCPLATDGSGHPGRPDGPPPPPHPRPDRSHPRRQRHGCPRRYERKRHQRDEALTMGLISFVLVSVLTVRGQATDHSCPSAKVLDVLWQASFSAVEQAIAAAERRDKVDLARLEFHVSTLGTISGAEANITYFGYLPDEHLRLMMSRWRDWYSNGLSQLCATAAPSRAESRGCAGQQRLTRLWLANTRSLERVLQDLERDRPISRDEFDELVGFFGRVTGLAAGAETRPPMAALSRLELATLVAKWQDWFAGHIGAMCPPGTR